MIASEVRATPLAATLWPAQEMQTCILRAMVLVALGSALLTVSAKLQVPFWPVPMTMHTFAVMVIGAAYGARLAGATVLVYLLQGALGLPVFSGGGGLAYLAGPTGGYLIGFLFAAITIGWLAERGFDRHLGTALIAFAVGDAVIFVFGLSWLSALIGFEQAIAAGLVPFLPAEALKIALAVAALPLAWRFLGRRRTG